MHLFVTGGSGLTGPAIVAELISAGHTVTGLARSDKSAARLDELGAGVLRGSLDDLEALGSAAHVADGVIHMAFGGDFADPASMTQRDCAAIDALGQALAGSGKPLVITSGTLVMAPGLVTTEHDSPDPNSLGSLRIPGEQTCLAFAEHGVRAIVLRLAPTVHGPGDYGFIPFLISAARKRESQPTSVMVRIVGPRSTGRTRPPSFSWPLKRRRLVALCTAQGKARSPLKRSRTLSGESSNYQSPL